MICGGHKMSIPAELVKKLREKTGVGLMACKRALEATDGDLDKAFYELRKEGLASAGKKAGRVATEGVVVIKRSEDKKTAVILEINSETDFAARDETFVAFTDQVAIAALEHSVETIDELADISYEDSVTVEQARQSLIAKVGENIILRRMRRISAGNNSVIGYYVHSNQKIGVIVNLSGEDELLARDIAMHVAASKPIVVHRDDIPAEIVEKEREVYTAQAQDSGKPDEIVQKMIEGKLSKFLDEVSLHGQPFIKDPGIQVSQLLKNADATVIQFIRYEVGEGVEKKADNFVDEVMAQVQDNLAEEEK